MGAGISSAGMHRSGDEKNDNMPPLEPHCAVPPKSKKMQDPHGAHDEDMPPLEYVGNSFSTAFSFREGDAVFLHGLSNEELNGQAGNILPLTQNPAGRLAVSLKQSSSTVS